MRYVVDEASLRALLRGEPLRVAEHLVVISPHIGWLVMTQAAIDAARVGPPPKSAQIYLREAPPEPAEADEFRDNRYRQPK